MGDYAYAATASGAVHRCLVRSGVLPLYALCGARIVKRANNAESSPCALCATVHKLETMDSDNVTRVTTAYLAATSIETGRYGHLGAKKEQPMTFAVVSAAIDANGKTSEELSKALGITKTRAAAALRTHKSRLRVEITGRGRNAIRRYFLVPAVPC